MREGAWEARAVSRKELQSTYPSPSKNPESRRWELQSDISAYPQLHSDRFLVDALYNLSLDELRKDIRPDGAFMAGAKWEGVWTRDISYSILLALASIEPEIAKASLLRKVARDRIIQDTGTGGSWPISTDRMTWALAAWEVYQVTGDRDWLAQAFGIIRNSAADDAQVIFSRRTGLVYGESSFLDWREQTYPAWMSPVDIYSSHALGTNTVHYRTYRILAEMARALDQPAAEYDATAERIRTAINGHLWLEQNGFYGQYLYGRNSLTVSPRSEALGEALAMLFDIASPRQQDRMLQTVPVMEYGIPSIYPETPGIPPYHNDSVWPFVQAFWNMAAARRRDGPALLQGIACMERAAALFVTNQENFVASTGSSQGTQINSPRQLWSVAGSLAMVYRVLFGMSFASDGLHLAPVIPKPFGGSNVLENFHYRAATLKISMQGYGSVIRAITLDGQPLAPAVIPADLQGGHQVQITMADDELPSGKPHLVSNAIAPEFPAIQQDAAILHWSSVPGAQHYVLVRNGERVDEIGSNSYTLPVSSEFAEYQVSAVDKQGVHSFLGPPLAVYDPNREMTVEAESAAAASAESLTGFSGKGFVELSRTVNRTIAWKVSVKEPGNYAVDFRYSNGSGPVNTDNKCAIRSLLVDGKAAGAMVFPQRGKDEWSNWGYSNRQHVMLTSGEHEITLRFEPADENMNGDVNRAMLDTLRLIRIFNEPE